MKIRSADTRSSVGRLRVIKSVKMKKTAVNVLKLLAGMLLGQIRIPGNCSPFAAGFTAACGADAGGACAAAGAMIGAAMGGFWNGIRYSAVSLLIYAAAYVFRDTRLITKKRFMPAVAAVMSACVGAVYINNGGRQLADIVLYAADIILSYGSCRLYSEGMKRKGGSGRLAGLAALGISLVMALGRTEVMDTVSVGRFAAALCVLGAAYTAGVGGGSAAGVALGIALELSAGGGGGVITALSLAGLFAGIFSSGRRLAAAVAYVLANAAAALLAAPEEMILGLMYEAFAASVIFMLPPESLFTGIFPRAPGRAYLGAEREKAYMTGKLEQASKAFADIYSVLARASESRSGDDGISAVFDVAAEKVCRGCAERDRCWGRDHEKTRGALADAGAVMNVRGSIRAEDIPEYFRNGCTELKPLIEQINTEMRALMRRRQMKKRIKEDRELLYNQFRDMSAVLDDIMRSSGGGGREERKTEQRLNDYLDASGSRCVCGVFRDRNGRLHVDVSGENLRALTSGKDWLESLSAAAQIRLCRPAEQPDGAVLSLYQAEPLEASVGIAALEREGSRGSGDMATWFKSPEGILYVIMSDGMGSGGEAADDSGTAVGIAERLLRAGIEPEYAMSIMNSAMMLKNEKNMACASVDLMALNLFTGETSMYKYGAAPSYLRRGDKLETVRGESFAAGLESRAPDVTRMTLGAGCAAVIVSDGADSPSAIYEKLMSFDGGSVKSLAAEILEKAAAELGRRDDMTVLAVSVAKRV
ncbi:MAG: SpoIIE family protein phosphatase [Oscillospiraceae bacterium]|nr:SpoIIE family protein phosphatase [Oscillospiraceae bacterium]